MDPLFDDQTREPDAMQAQVDALLKRLRAAEVELEYMPEAISIGRNFAFWLTMLVVASKFSDALSPLVSSVCFIALVAWNWGKHRDFAERYEAAKKGLQ